MGELKEATIITCMVLSIPCPHCNYTITGYVGDPRGGIDDCPECGEKIKIPENIELEFI